MKDLVFYGIGGALNSDFYPNCAALIEKNNFVVIDPNYNCVQKLLKNKVLSDKTNNIYIVITHTHADHISGLGALIWQCGIVFKKTPIILANSKTFINHLDKLIQMMGVDKKYYKFSTSNKIKFENIIIKAKKTLHTPDLECFGVEFQDEQGKYYYSGDTRDLDYIKKINNDKNYKKIYVEISNYPKSHIDYEQIKKFENTSKLVAMHFETKELYNQANKDKLLKISKQM